MDTIRKFGIGMIMIIPGFVFGGVVWAWLGSWWAVLGVEIVMVVLYFLIISGKFSLDGQEA